MREVYTVVEKQRCSDKVATFRGKTSFGEIVTVKAFQRAGHAMNVITHAKVGDSISLIVKPGTNPQNGYDEFIVDSLDNDFDLSTEPKKHYVKNTWHPDPSVKRVITIPIDKWFVVADPYSYSEVKDAKGNVDCLFTAQTIGAKADDVFTARLSRHEVTKLHSMVTAAKDNGLQPVTIYAYRAIEHESGERRYSSLAYIAQ